jgi:hypothetical protein
LRKTAEAHKDKISAWWAGVQRSWNVVGDVRKPPSGFASLGSPGIDAIAAKLDDKIRTIVKVSCR